MIDMAAVRLQSPIISDLPSDILGDEIDALALEALSMGRAEGFVGGWNLAVWRYGEAFWSAIKHQGRVTEVTAKDPRSAVRELLIAEVRRLDGE